MKYSLKRILALLLSVIMVFFAAGCAEIVTGVLEGIASELENTSEAASSAAFSSDRSSKTESRQESSKAESSKAESSKAESSKAESSQQASSVQESSKEEKLDENGRYYSKEEVALYIHQYGKLPCNYLTKDQAKNLGWVSSKGNLWDVTDHMVIGGDRFGNYEGLLPSKKGRTYKECDVDYEGGYRGEDRLIFSNDGLVYYTGDHYNSFELLYGEE